MPPKKQSKDAREKWMNSYAVDLALRPTQFGPNGVVKSAACMFCEKYGREESTAVTDERALALSTEEERLRKRRKTTNTQHWTKFRADNIQKHHREQHPKRWAEYLVLLQRKELEPEIPKLFIEQLRMDPVYEKRENIEGNQSSLFIDKNIVENVVREMLYNPSDANHQIAGDRAMDVFEPIFSIENDGSKTVERYQIAMSTPMEFDYVVSLLATGLTFSQVSHVMDSNLSVLGNTGKQKCLTPGEVSCTSRIICAVALQLLSDLMRNSWAFSIATDASTDGFGNAHLDVRIRMPSVKTGNRLLSFHLLTIPLFNELHSGQSLYEFITRLLNALCPDWYCRLIGLSIDGLPIMTGIAQVFSSRLSDVVSEFGPLYRIWCLAHQLDIIVKASIVAMQSLVNFPFENTFTTLVGYLRKQETWIRTMGSKCPSWSNVRWKSMSNVLQWQLNHRVQIQSFCIDKQFESTPTSQWWLVSMVLQKHFFERINLTFSALQTDSTVVSKQYDALGRLLSNLQAQCGAIRNEEMSCEDNRLTFGNGASVMGQFAIDASGLYTLVRSTGVAAQEVQEGLHPHEYSEVIRALSVVYLTALNGIAIVLKCRQGTYVESETMPPVLPLELIQTSQFDFIQLVRKHKKRLVNHFQDKADSIIERICDQHTKLKQCVSSELSLESSLHSSCNQDFDLAWAPAGSRFQDLQRFSVGLATVMPTTSRVEGDFSLTHFRRNEYCSNLSSFALEGMMHSKQLHDLQNAVIYIE